MRLEVRELAASEYPCWDQLVAVSPQRSLFVQRWWMDIVTRGEVRLLGCFQHDQLLAGLPIWPYSTLGVRRLRQPPLTPYWGPMLFPLRGEYHTRLNHEIAILHALARALLPWPDITMQCHPNTTNWLGFYWNDFSQTTRYTYRIDDWTQLSPQEVIAHESIRSSLRRAHKFALSVQDMVDPQVVLRQTQLSMGRQGLHSSDEIQRCWSTLADEALRRNCMFTTSVVDADGNVHGAVATVWDDRCAYGIYGGADPQFRHTGGWTLCMARELELARTVAPAYDFEGSMLETVEPFFRRFGGTLTPYFLVTRSASLRLNAARLIADKCCAGKQWVQQALGWRKPAAPNGYADVREVAAHCSDAR